MTITAEKFKENDAKIFINELLEQFKAHHVKDVKIENVMRVGNKDVVAISSSYVPWR